MAEFFSTEQVKDLCIAIGEMEGIQVDISSQKESKMTIRVKRKDSTDPGGDVPINDDNIKPFCDVMKMFINAAAREKLMKRMPKNLLKLKTSDFDTALQNIRSDSYKSVRKSLSKDLEKFVTKDLGMKVAK